MSAVEAGGQIESLVRRLRVLEDERTAIVQECAPHPAKKRSLKPPKDLAALFSRQIDDLAASLNADEQTRQEAVPLLRQIFSAIRVHPLEGRGNLKIEVESRPHMAWLVSEGQASRIMLPMVAEEGLEPPTPGL